MFGRPPVLAPIVAAPGEVAALSAEGAQPSRRLNRRATPFINHRKVDDVDTHHYAKHRDALQPLLIQHPGAEVTLSTVGHLWRE